MVKSGGEKDFMEEMETRTVLFVDDEKEILNSLRRLLRTEQYNLLFAQNGVEALHLIEKEDVHVIVTDLGMPGMDGLELLGQVQERFNEIIRLVFSGRGGRESILDAINGGNVYRYVVKPWDNMELKLIVRQAIEQFDFQQERRDLLKNLEEYNLLLEKKVEERTQQLLAIEKQAEIGKHASQIVHNINSPLQSMIGGLQLAQMELSRKDPELKKLKEWLELIESSTSDLGKIVAGIVIHARTGDYLLTEEIDINDVIQREIEFFSLNTTFKYDIEKKIVLSEHIPHIKGNPIHFKQIVDNILKNAIDTLADSPTKSLTIETGLENGAVTISIADTGHGIEEEDLDKIFSPDFTTKPVGEGTGLGLASVKTMVEAYSGEIQVKSERGKGTTFVVKIPVNQAMSQH